MTPERSAAAGGARAPQAREPDEAALVAAARGGDGDAFGELVGRHMRRAFALAYRLLGHREDAEDLVQESFLAALRALDTFDTTRSFGPWLMRIVLNRGLNLRKARALRRTEPLPAVLAGAGATPLELAERSELRLHLERALDALPETRRQVLELFELEGFTGAEISEITGVPEGTVRWHVHQARRALRAALEPHTKRS